MKFTIPAFVFLCMLPFQGSTQNRGIGLRTGVALWHGTYDNFSREKIQRKPILEKELFVRRNVGSRLVLEVSLGHRKFSDHYRVPSFGLAETYKNVRTNSYSLGLAVDYALGKKSNATALYAGWGFMLQHLENQREEYTFDLGTRVRAEVSSGLEDIWMSGPQASIVHGVSRRFSLLGKAAYLTDVSSVVHYYGKSGAALNQDVRGCVTVSFGASYSF